MREKGLDPLHLELPYRQSSSRGQRRGVVLQLPPASGTPAAGPPSQARALPSRAAASGHRRSRQAPPAPSGSPSPPGRSLGREIPGRAEPRPGQGGMISAPLLSAARPGRGRRTRPPPRGGCGGEGASGPGRGGGSVPAALLPSMRGLRRWAMPLDRSYT